MPFHIGSGCLPATISNRRIYRIAWSDTPPEMSSWEKMKEFFCSTHQAEALECIWTICHPPAGTTREDVVSRFELLRTLAYADGRKAFIPASTGKITSVFWMKTVRRYYQSPWMTSGTIP